MIYRYYGTKSVRPQKAKSQKPYINKNLRHKFLKRSKLKNRTNKTKNPSDYRITRNNVILYNVEQCCRIK